MHQLNVLIFGPSSFISTLNELKPFLKFNHFSDFKDKKINFKSAVLYKKEKSNFKSDYIVHNLQDNPWIVFPYELRELISIEDLKKELK